MGSNSKEHGSLVRNLLLSHLLVLSLTHSPSHRPGGIPGEGRGGLAAGLRDPSGEGGAKTRVEVQGRKRGAAGGCPAMGTGQGSAAQRGRAAWHGPSSALGSWSLVPPGKLAKGCW